MLRRCSLAVLVSSVLAMGALACSGSDAPAGEGSTEARPLLGADQDALDPSSLSQFVDEATGFSTDAVHDADREIVHFNAALAAMVADGSGDAVGGWTVSGNELRWSRNGVPFRVRFGTEAGQRRAYFTEAGPGTICDLRLSGPDQLLISATREMPPNP